MKRATGFILLMITTVWLLLLAANLSVFFNLPSLLYILMVAIFGLMASNANLANMLHSLKNAEHCVKSEALADWQVLRRLMNLAGISGVVIGAIGILANLDDPKRMGPALAVALLTLFYSLTINLIFCVPMARALKS